MEMTENGWGIARAAIRKRLKPQFPQADLDDATQDAVIRFNDLLCEGREFGLAVFLAARAQTEYCMKSHSVTLPSGKRRKIRDGVQYRSADRIERADWESEVDMRRIEQHVIGDYTRQASAGIAISEDGSI